MARLSILVGMDSFAYMITDDKRSVVALKQFHFEEKVRNPIELGRKLQPLLVEDTLLNGTFERTFVAIDTTNFTLVPDLLFDENEVASYLTDVTYVSENDKILVDKFAFIPSKLIYPIDKGIQFLLKLHFPDCEIFNVFSALLGSARQMILQEGVTGKYLFVNVRRSTLQVLLFEDEKLLIANAYSYRGLDDFQYFIFLIFHQFKLDPAKTPIYLAGQIDEKHEKFTVLHDRIEQVHLVDWPVTLLTGPNFANGSKHQFFDLAGLMYC